MQVLICDRQVEEETGGSLISGFGVENTLRMLREDQQLQKLVAEFKAVTATCSERTAICFDVANERAEEFIQAVNRTCPRLLAKKPGQKI